MVGVSYQYQDCNGNSQDKKNSFTFWCNNGKKAHNGSVTEYTEKVPLGATVTCILDMDEGNLSFFVNGNYKGIAYKDSKLRFGQYYPTIRMYYKDDVVKLDRLDHIFKNESDDSIVRVLKYLNIVNHEDVCFFQDAYLRMTDSDMDKATKTKLLLVGIGGRHNLIKEVDELIKATNESMEPQNDENFNRIVIMSKIINSYLVPELVGQNKISDEAIKFAMKTC